LKKWMLLFVMASFIAASLSLVGCGGSKQEAVPSVKQESVADLFAKGKNIPGMSYDFVMTGKDSNMTGAMWISGKKMKSEMTIEKNKMMTIIDSDANVVYTYSQDQGVAFKMPINNTMKTADTPDRFTKDVDTGKVKILETTTYEGVKCKVVLIQDGDSKAQTKMWIREDYGVPIRVEVTDLGGEKTVMEYKNLKIGAQPANVFQLPAGVEVMDAGEMMKKASPQ